MEKSTNLLKTSHFDEIYNNVEIICFNMKVLKNILEELLIKYSNIIELNINTNYKNDIKFFVRIKNNSNFKKNLFNSGLEIYNKFIYKIPNKYELYCNNKNDIYQIYEYDVPYEHEFTISDIPFLTNVLRSYKKNLEYDSM